MGLSREEAAAADAADPLRPLRERFDLPEGLIYLDGNSLGPLPRAAAERLRHVIETEWGEGLITSWNAHDWIGAPQRVGGVGGDRVFTGRAHQPRSDSRSARWISSTAAAQAALSGAMSSTWPVRSIIRTRTSSPAARALRS